MQLCDVLHNWILSVVEKQITAAEEPCYELIRFRVGGLDERF